MDLLIKISILFLAFLVGESVTQMAFFESDIDHPDYKLIFCEDDTCLDAYIEFFAVAKGCLFYDLSHPKVKEAINHLDIEYFTDIKGGGLMHHKFCYSKNKVLTGSANPTTGDLLKNRNHLLLIDSFDIARKFEKEFDRVKARKLKINSTIEDSYFEPLLLENLSLYFCNIHDCTSSLVSIIDNSNESIEFLTFTFTDFEVAKALIRADQRGVNVTGITDTFQSRRFWQKDFLARNNVNVTVHGASKLQHNKVFMVDKDILATGSFNPTKAANSINDEAFMIIRNSSLVQSFHEEFLKILNESR